MLHVSPEYQRLLAFHEGHAPHASLGNPFALAFPLVQAGPARQVDLVFPEALQRVRSVCVCVCVCVGGWVHIRSHTSTRFIRARAVTAISNMCRSDCKSDDPCLGQCPAIESGIMRTSNTASNIGRHGYFLPGGPSLPLGPGICEMPSAPVCVCVCVCVFWKLRGARARTSL